ncbi:hypothetical protein GCM10009639_23730 [Kitasatospora putterlickiae]|uniref:Gram-positive cocci surface proteins LPxTG domain-containing protein n=2 Tax=Kitasatospora putterlickiae TaxID=221725 RepID=A0ABN1XXI6_9ACTN
MALLIGTGAFVAPFLTAQQSHAAAGDPFDPADPQVFVAQELPTRLYRSVTGASGTVTFQPEGSAVTGLNYNAISYNPADNYLYGVVSGGSTALPPGAVIRIGQGGVVKRVGTSVVPLAGNWGAFAPDGGLYIGASLSNSTVYRIDVTTGNVTSTITLPDVSPTGDLTYASGFFWGADANGKIVRVDLLGATKSVTVFPNATVSAGGYGAAWTFGNGNIGLSDNYSGTVYQVKITNPAAANPTFTIVSTSPGPASGNNDGTASAGLPTDLSIVKSGPDLVKPGSPVTYTLKVRNNGAGNSSGYTVTDTVPAPLTNVKTSTPGCTVAGNTVTCVGGRTLAGVENTITITADSPAAMTGCVTNTGSVLANEQDPTAGNNQSSVKTCAVVPALTVEKSADPGTVSAVGESVKYSFVLTNTGNVELSNPGVTETAFSGGTPPAVTCPAGPLAPGGSLTCTATYTVTQGDLDAGSIKNTATAHGTAPGDTTPTVSPPDSATVAATSSPALKVVKSATTSQPDKLVLGEQITYDFVVTNTGNVTLKDVKVTETTFTGTGTPPVPVCPTGPAAALAPGAEMTCTATYTVTQADVDAGSIKNIATGTGNPPTGPPPVSPPSEVTVPSPSDPKLTVVKTASTGKLVAGEKVTYGFRVTNTGNVTLTDVKVTETAFTGSGTLDPVSCPTGAASLAPGASVTCTATYTVTQADVDAGSVKNTATATGTPPTGPPPVSPPSEVTITQPPAPAMTVAKTAATSRPDKLVLGETITYSFEVKNTGNVTLKDVKVTEGTFTGSGTLSPVTCPTAEAASLAPGATVTCTATYTVTQADVDAGSIKNSATATGVPPTGPPPVSPPSEVTVPAPSDPKLTVVKSASTGKLVAGEQITYSFEVKNTGNVTLTDVKVTEGEFTGSGALSPVTCPSGTASLAPGAVVTCTATYTVTQADVDAGSVKNTATATGVPPSGPPPVSPPSEVTITEPPAPALAVAKTSSTDKLVAGEKITYSFAVTNTGNVTVKDVKVTDGPFTGSGTLDPVTCPAEAASLAPGSTVTCTAAYTVTQADVDAGSVKNSATATGTPPTGPPPVSPPSEVTVTTPDEPGVSVVKYASTGTLVVGEEIVYKFEVKNTGNVTLTDVKVTEGAFTGSGTLSPVTCPSGTASLAPGASVTCTATYTVTQADVDAGSVKNTATATGTPPRGEPPVSPPSETTVSTQDQPGLSVVKTGHSGKPDELVVGEQIRYDFTVTNTGNVTLKDIKVNEGEFTGHGTLSPVTCPTAEAASLAPGASMTCTATYTVTQADVDAGSIKNSATATGTPPRGEPPVSPPSETVVPAPEKPALAVVKTSSTDKLVAGERITYSFAVTNTGNVTLKNVTVKEGEFTGHGKLDPVVCPKEAATLAPGATVLCTAAYTVTQADVDAGSVKNTATATGTPPRGEPPVSPPSETTVTTQDQPGLSVVKSASAGQQDKLVAGEKITYGFTVRNTGNVTLKDIKVNEGEFTGHGKLDPVTCPSGSTSLAPGATVTCTATYTVTQADVDAGSVKNSATATGTPPRGEPPVSPPSEVELPQQPKPSLAVVKSAETGKPGKLVTGEKITYRFAVTNTGNVTIKDVKVNEGEFTGTGRLSAVVCPKEAATLAPGATVTCTATYTVTQADVDAGTIRNTATATGTPPRGEPPVSPPSGITVPSDGRGALGLTKTADVVDVNGNGRTDTGDRVEWKLTVANQGTATVTGIKVSDPTAGEVTCPRTSLAPGESMTCTTQPHTVTAEDAQRGKVVNTATATGTGATRSEATATVKVEPGNPPAPVPAAPKPSGPTGILAHTGTAVLTVAGIGGALLVLGGLVLALARLRRRDR